MAKNKFETWVEKQDLDTRIALAKEKTANIVNHLQHVIALHESNRFLVFSDIIGKQMKTSFGAHTFNLLRVSQLRYEILKLTALWDSPSENRESIPTIAALIDHDKIRSKLEQEMENYWSKEDDSRFGKQQSENVKRWLSNSVKISAKVTRHERFKAMIDFRDHHIAHNLDTNAQRRAPDAKSKSGDEKRLMRISIRAVKMLYLGVCHTDFAADQSTEISKKNARLFWEGVTVKVLG